jgi:neutral amino acid transport system permease protein
VRGRGRHHDRRATDGTATETVTDADGAGLVVLPDRATYRVELQVATLPEGIGLRDPDVTSLEVRVFENSTSAVVFALGEPQEGSPTCCVASSRADAQRPEVRADHRDDVDRAVADLRDDRARQLRPWRPRDRRRVPRLLPQRHARTPLLVAGPLAVVAGALSPGRSTAIWRPLRARQTGLIAMLVVSIGLAFVLRHVVLLFFGGSRLAYTDFTSADRARHSASCASSPSSCG